jgi:hypothetical protein
MNVSKTLNSSVFHACGNHFCCFIIFSSTGISLNLKNWVANLRANSRLGLELSTVFSRISGVMAEFIFTKYAIVSLCLALPFGLQDSKGVQDTPPSAHFCIRTGSLERNEE